MTAGLARSIGAAAAAARGALSSLWKLEARVKGVELGRQITLIGRPIVSVAAGSRLILGDGVILASAVRATPLGCFQPCVLRTMMPGAELRLGRNTGLSATVICAGLLIDIGENTLIGAGAMIIDNDFHHLGPTGWINDSRHNARPIEIGRQVFIGARAIILKGVTIGDRAVIGAGAVVSKDVPADSIAIGNPAQIRAKTAPRAEEE